MVVQSEDITRRNFYLTLFRLYAALPFQECMQSFAKIYNDVFIHERPSCVQKYSLTEVLITEMLQAEEDKPAKLRETHSIPYSFNFMAGTTRHVKYSSMESFH